MSNDCGGCNHISTHPHTLIGGRVVCQTCPRAGEERAMLERHVSNMNRLPNLQARRDYAEKLEASAGPSVASAVKVAFTLAWNARNQDPQQ
jgi:hypothetical protein